MERQQMHKHLFFTLLIVVLLLSSCIMAPVQGSGNVVSETESP
ncbi:MAG: hypothetical protein R3E79_61540 [Caldilineaceae bacterium]